MKLHIYAPCWNEIQMLPFFLKHYENLAEKIFIFDNGSTDGSVEFLKKHPKVVLKNFEISEDSQVLGILKIYNHAWKQSRGIADWVIVCNVDEHLNHPDLKNYLIHCQNQNITAIPCMGYEMVSLRFPKENEALSMRGMRHPFMDKLCIFNPNQIQEINYIHGRHSACPEGRVIYPKHTSVRLLHYKYLGLEYTYARHQELGARLKKKDQEKSFGLQYQWNFEKINRVFKILQSCSINLKNPISLWIVESIPVKLWKSLIKKYIFEKSSANLKNKLASQTTLAL